MYNSEMYNNKIIAVIMYLLSRYISTLFFSDDDISMK